MVVRVEIGFVTFECGKMVREDGISIEAWNEVLDSDVEEMRAVVESLRADDGVWLLGKEMWLCGVEMGLDGRG
ncbi:hypothetical protein V6N13_084005 [Hibiscus sabdariffa]|uniref:Uncharacterized protein n=1 Tax=Hibiscus sabdariffa TaxID=183260 RepID=A0ABR2T0F5_9ROSI